MKKGVVILVIVLALLVIVSPGIIGKLSEQSLNENLNRAVDHSAELVVTSSGFERSWFSSEGEHRVELGDGGLRDAFGALAGDGDNSPVLVIRTKIDHGIIPVTSLSREHGSLAPGLGSAVSTLQLQSGDGDVRELPGAIYSTIDLNGDLNSSYAIEAGSHADGDESIEWQAVTIEVQADASSGGYTVNGDIGGSVFSDAQNTLTMGPIHFSGEQTPSGYGFMVGDISVEMDALDVTTASSLSTSMQGIRIEATTELNDDRASSRALVSLDGMTVPQFGDVSMQLQATSASDAAALGALMTAIDALPANPDPATDLLAVEDEAKDLFAAGIDIDVPKLDIALPMGTMEMLLSFTAPQQDRDSFEWTSLLLKGKASFDLRVPEALVQMATSMSPEAGAIIATGYLRKEGDHYVMDADMEKGLLTVNGAPIPIPIGAF